MHYLLVVLLLITSNLFATTIRSTATGGYWDAGTSWVGGVVPGDGDTAHVVLGSTITIRGDVTIGTGVAGNVAILSSGTLNVPYDAPTCTLTAKGNVYFWNNSKWTIGTYATPYLSTNTFTFQIQCASARQFQFYCDNDTNQAELYWYGCVENQSDTSVPLEGILTADLTTSTNAVTVNAALDAKVGQRFIITGSANVNQNDLLTVTNWDAATKKITFSANPTYNHVAGCRMLNYDRNIVVKAQNATYQPYITLAADATDPVNASSRADINYVLFNNIGGNGNGLTFGCIYSTMTHCVYDQCSSFVAGGTGCTFTYNVVSRDSYDNNTWLVSGYYNGIFSNNWILGNARTYCFYITNSANNTFSDNYLNGTEIGYMEYQGNNANKFYNTQFDFVYRTYFGCMYATVNGFNDSYISSYTSVSPNVSYVKPPAYFRNGTNVYSKFTVINGEAGNASFVGTAGTTYAAQDYYETFQMEGSEIRWHNYNKQAGIHKIFMPCGMVYVDTTTYRDSSQLSMAFAEAGFNGGGSLGIGAYKTAVTFTVPATDDDTILLRGYARKNTSYGSTSLPYIKVYTDDGYVNTISSMSDVNDTWELIAVYDTMESTTSVKVEVGMKALSAGATCYFDDLRLYVGNSVYSLGEEWVDGYPIASPIASTVDATNVWGASTGTFTTSGTFGGVVGAYIDVPISSAGGISLSTTTIAEGVWNANLDSYQTSGSFGETVKKMWNKIKAIFATQ